MAEPEVLADLQARVWGMAATAAEGRMQDLHTLLTALSHGEVVLVASGMAELAVSLLLPQDRPATVAERAHVAEAMRQVGLQQQLQNGAAE